MKFCLALSFLVSSVCFGQVVLLSEDFNSGWPAGWEIYDEDGLTPDANVSYVDTAWVLAEDSDTTGTGDSCALSTSWYDPTGQSEDWLVLPSVTLGAGGNYLHWDAKSEDPAFPDTYEIWISSTGNTPADFTDSAYFSVVDESPYWERHSINLDSFVNQTVYIAFVNVSDDKFLLFLDNIQVVEGDPLGIQEEEVSVLVYPNPAIDQIKFERYNVQGPVSVIGLDGQRHRLPGNNGTYDVSQLATGIYRAQIAINGTLRYIPFVKN